MDVLCSVEVAPVRAEPREEAERVTEPLCGEPVAVEGSGLVHIPDRRLGHLVPRDADRQEAAGAPVEERLSSRHSAAD
jgi:hypothetical protein